MKPYRCRQCGAPIRRYNSREFCNAACKQRAYRRRQRGADEDIPRRHTEGSHSTIDSYQRLRERLRSRDRNAPATRANP